MGLMTCADCATQTFRAEEFMQNRRTERFLQERQAQLRAQLHTTIALSRETITEQGETGQTRKQRPKITCAMLNETERQLLRVKHHAQCMQSAGEPVARRPHPVRAEWSYAPLAAGLMSPAASPKESSKPDPRLVCRVPERPYSAAHATVVNAAIGSRVTYDATRASRTPYDAARAAAWAPHAAAPQVGGGRPVSAHQPEQQLRAAYTQQPVGALRPATAVCLRPSGKPSVAGRPPTGGPSRAITADHQMGGQMNGHVGGRVQGWHPVGAEGRRPSSSQPSSSRLSSRQHPGPSSGAVPDHCEEATREDTAGRRSGGDAWAQAAMVETAKQRAAQPRPAFAPVRAHEGGAVALASTLATEKDEGEGEGEGEEWQAHLQTHLRERQRLVQLCLRACAEGGTGVGNIVAEPVGLSDLYKVGRPIGEGAFGFVRVSYKGLEAACILPPASSRLHPPACIRSPASSRKGGSFAFSAGARVGCTQLSCVLALQAGLFQSVSSSRAPAVSGSWRRTESRTS